MNKFNNSLQIKLINLNEKVYNNNYICINLIIIKLEKKLYSLRSKIKDQKKSYKIIVNNIINNFIINNI